MHNREYHISQMKLTEGWDSEKNVQLQIYLLHQRHGSINTQHSKATDIIEPWLEPNVAV